VDVDTLEQENKIVDSVKRDWDVGTVEDEEIEDSLIVDERVGDVDGVVLRVDEDDGGGDGGDNKDDEESKEEELFSDLFEIALLPLGIVSVLHDLGVLTSINADSVDMIGVSDDRSSHDQVFHGQLFGVETSINLNRSFEVKLLVGWFIRKTGSEFLNRSDVLSSLNAFLEVVLGESVDALSISPTDLTSSFVEGSVEDNDISRTDFISFDLDYVSWSELGPVNFHKFSSFSTFLKK
jgi:hypothetical protein